MAYERPLFIGKSALSTRTSELSSEFDSRNTQACSNSSICVGLWSGSGQLTQLLAPHFDAVVATDISAHQLQHAPYFENVSYQVQSAEHTSFAEQSFDLITVAQAIHWFDFDGFYAEVRRTLRPEGILAVIGYGLIQLQQPELQVVLSDFILRL